MKFSRRARNLTGSATMSATLKAQALKSQGQDILLASVGEPYTPVSPDIEEAAHDYLKNHDSRYGPAQGLLSTRKVLSQWFQKVYGTTYSPEQIVITPGSKFGLFALMQILCDTEDEVLIPAPYWVSYIQLAEMAGARARICAPNAHYKLTPEILRKELNEKSRVLILNSPNNPTGAVYTLSELEGLRTVLKDFPDVTIICDDIYNQLNFSSHHRAPSILDGADEEFQKRIVVVHGASKSYAMTGWRVGWIAADNECVTKLTQFLSQSLTCIPDFIQKATEQALTSGDSFVQKLKQQMQERHTWSVQELSSLKRVQVYKSEGAFYLWIKLLETSLSSQQVAEKLLTDQGVASVPGEAFGMPAHLRLAITISESEVKEMIQRLKKFFAEEKV